MYCLNKIAGLVVNPTVVGLAGLLLGGLFLLRGKVRWSFVAIWAVFWLWTTPLATRVVGLPLEREWLTDGSVPSIGSFPSADAIVCLGGGMGGEACGSAGEMWSSADRVWQAARLYKAGKAPKVVCTGPGCAATTKALLADFAVPTNALVFLEKPRNTEEEARELAGRADKIRKVLLVTSAWHMRRAMLMFGKYASGLEVVPVPTDFEATISTVRFSWAECFRPSGRSLAVNEACFREWLGYLGYRILR